uniref:Uncharacterized protein LOC114343649 n=1 Tax=Diabrotica virgifera virgifera TaxID=50390 RepID=A0A6P7GW68_DIAVI
MEGTAVVDLLGQPYQQELALEVGIDLALIELEELKLSSYKVTSLVSALLEDCAAAKIAGVILQEKLNEISLQLTIARQQCDLKDRTLCYTLQHSGFEVSFSMDNCQLPAPGKAFKLQDAPQYLFYLLIKDISYDQPSYQDVLRSITSIERECAGVQRAKVSHCRVAGLSCRVVVLDPQ